MTFLTPQLFFSLLFGSSAWEPASLLFLTGIIEVKLLKLFVPAAVVAQMLMFLFDKFGAAFYCGAFSNFTIVILNMIEKGYTYIYLALALAAMFGMMQRYHRD